MLHRLPPEILEAHLASEVLGFGTGLALSALLIGLLRRGAGKRADARARYYQAAAALMWNLGGLLGVLLALFGARDQQALFLTASVLHFSGAAFFPPAFLALWRKPSDEQSTRAKACRFLCRVSFVSGLTLTLSFIATVSLSNIPPDGDVFDKNLMGKLVAWHAAVVIGLGALLLLRDRLNDFVSRFYAGATLIGASAPAVMTLTAWHPSDLSPSLFLAYCVVMHQSPLLVLLGAIVFFADFRFSNVYVKSSLQLLTGLLLALAFCLLITGPLPRLTGRMTNYPTGSLVSFATAFHLVKKYSSRGLESTPLSGGLARHKLRLVEEYIAANFGRDLSLSEVSSAAGLSPFHFARAFKRSTGMPPHQYLTRVRIERARALLASSDLSIVDICFRVGFKSQSYFTTLFRNQYSTTPAAYRHAARR